jgi:hypothetical protein
MSVNADRDCSPFDCRSSEISASGPSRPKKIPRLIGTKLKRESSTDGVNNEIKHEVNPEIKDKVKVENKVNEKEEIKDEVIKDEIMEDENKDEENYNNHNDNGKDHHDDEEEANAKAVCPTPKKAETASVVSAHDQQQKEPHPKALAAVSKSGAVKSSAKSGGNAATKILNIVAARMAKFGRSTAKEHLPVYAAIAGRSTIRNGLARLKKQGLITVTRTGEVVPTDKGMESADWTNVNLDNIPSTNEDYHKIVKTSKKLSDRERKLFDHIADGQPHLKADIREALGYLNNSTWRNLMARLKKKDVMEYPNSKSVQLVKRMFPFERSEPSRPEATPLISSTMSTRESSDVNNDNQDEDKRNNQ